MTHRPARWLLAMLLPLALFAAACGSDDDKGADSADGGGEASGACAEATAPDDAPAIKIGAQDFGESAILAEVYKQCLAAAGYDVSIQAVGGFRDLELAAFKRGDINLAPEYSASMLEALNEQAGEATGDAAETTDKLNGYLADIDLVALTPSEAIDTNALVVTKETSEDLGITKLSDLADHTDLKLGGPADCETNAFCLPGLKDIYDVDLSAGFVPLEPAAVAPALDAGEIDIALLFSTDSRIVTNDYVLLEDDKGMLAADNVVPVLSKELSEVDGLSDLLDAISESLSTEGLTELNRRFDVDVEDADAIAKSHLKDEGLL